MAELTDKPTWLLLVAILCLFHCDAGTINPEWCNRQCTCLNDFRTADCSRRQITEVPSLSNLTNNLYLDNNHIQEISTSAFQSLANLIDLRLENNAIEPVSWEHFCGLHKLYKLNLSNNKLQSFIIPENVSEECQLPALNQLLLSGNELMDIPQNLPYLTPNLETLDISFNSITTVSFSKNFSILQSLRTLDLRANQIYQITEAEFLPLKSMHLNTLSLSECRLSHIEAEAFAGLTDLVSLSLSRNSIAPQKLEQIFTAMGNTSQLFRLDLCEMVIPNLTISMIGMFKHLGILDVFESNVKQIEPELFNLLPDLETLNIGYNDLEQLNNLQALKKLRRLQVAKNQLKEIDLSQLDNLEIIDISHNKIESLPPEWLGHKQNLQQLNISHNHITSVDEETFLDLSLQHLDLSFNKITTLNGTGLKRLSKMNLSHNRLSLVPLKAFVNLEDTLADLDLSYNNLTALPPDHKLKEFKTLQELYLDYNGLGQVLKNGGLVEFFRSMSHLQSLYLSGNALTSMAPEQLHYLHHLTTIDLSYNNISELADIGLAQVTSLSKLVVTDNKLKSINTSLVNKLECLEEVDFSNNPFDCSSCFIQPFFQWMNHSAVKVLDIRDGLKYQCSSPQELKGQYLLDYRPQEDKNCEWQSDFGHTRLDWAMVGVAVVGVVIFLILVAVLVFYTQVCHKIKSLHYKWQIRYREVSGVEITNDPRV